MPDTFKLHLCFLYLSKIFYDRLAFMERKLSQHIFKYYVSGVIDSSKLYVKLLENIVEVCISSNKGIYVNVYWYVDGGQSPNPSLDYVIRFIGNGQIVDCWIYKPLHVLTYHVQVNSKFPCLEVVWTSQLLIFRHGKINNIVGHDKKSEKVNISTLNQEKKQKKTR